MTWGPAGEITLRRDGRACLQGDLSKQGTKPLWAWLRADPGRSLTNVLVHVSGDSNVIDVGGRCGVEDHRPMQSRVVEEVKLCVLDKVTLGVPRTEQGDSGLALNPSISTQMSPWPPRARASPLLKPPCPLVGRHLGRVWSGGGGRGSPGVLQGQRLQTPGQGRAPYSLSAGCAVAERRCTASRAGPGVGKAVPEAGCDL